jgi:predicted small lipoprotein YifL
MKLTLRTLLSILAVGFILAGCGNKGDLVMPDPPEPAPAEAPATQ